MYKNFLNSKHKNYEVKAILHMKFRVKYKKKMINTI
jgi:hypothetical protein